MFFRRRSSSADPPSVPPIPLPSGEMVPVTCRVSARAGRMALRIRPAGGVELVMPAGGSWRAALAFLDSRRGWVAAQLARLPPSVPFVDGAMVPILGTAHVLRHLGSAERGRPRPKPFRIGDGVIEVTGAPEHLGRRTRAGLSAHARDMLAAKTAAAALRLGQRAGHVSVGDPRSRWGSCTASGDIRFSWRLILAPENVLDYVVAHEVAHLAELNHGHRFWRLVEQLHPGHETERAWLKRHGAQLLRYG